MKHQSMRSLLITVIVTLVVLTIATFAWPQALEPQHISCNACQFENDWANKFCVNCGVSLAASKQAKLAALLREQEQARIEARRKFVADSLARAQAAEQHRLAREKATAAQISRNAATRVDTSAEEVREDARVPAFPAPKDKRPWYQTMLSAPAELPRLFNVPTPEVLGSLDLYFTGGGAFGIEKERNFLGHAGLGLGDIAEVEFATQAVINSLQQGSSSVPTSAFKMQMLREREKLPAIAASLRGTTSWHYLEGNDPNISFETRLTKLYLVASKQFGQVTAHLGAGLTDVRVRNPRGWRFHNPAEKELQRNLIAPFGGVSIQANPKALVMIEIEGLPSYNFVEGGTYDGGGIKNIWAGVIGVRFYFTNWLAADTGVRYRSDFDGIADANIQANINMLLPLGRLRTVTKAN